jgi:hypothetical protein
VILPASGRQISAKSLRMMVARDGVEPPTPAFSGLESPKAILFILQDIALKTYLILAFLLEPKWSQDVQI